jgi:hypothetical protein
MRSGVVGYSETSLQLQLRSSLPVLRPSLFIGEQRNLDGHRAPPPPLSAPAAPP